MAKAFRFGVVSTGNASRSAWVTLAQRVEELGYASLLMPDRTITPLAALTALAVAATVTTTLHVGSYVFANDYRHPVLLAREVATPHWSRRSAGYTRQQASILIGWNSASLHLGWH